MVESGSDRVSREELYAAVAAVGLTPTASALENMEKALSAAAFVRPDPDWDMRQELWECYCATGADPDDADARHLNPGEALLAVRELRDDSDGLADWEVVATQLYKTGCVLNRELGHLARYPERTDFVDALKAFERASGPETEGR